MHQLSPPFGVGDKEKLTSAFHIDVNLPHTPWTTPLSCPSVLTRLQLQASLPPHLTLHAPELYNIPSMSISIPLPPPPKNSKHFATEQLTYRTRSTKAVARSPSCHCNHQTQRACNQSTKLTEEVGKL